MALPKQDYFRLEIIEKQWSISHDEVMYAVENNLLKVCVWLPICFVEYGKEEGCQFHTAICEHYEGLVGVRPKDCHMLFQRGESSLTHFLAVGHKQHSDIRIADEPQQPPLMVLERDLLVMNNDKEAFEKEYQIGTVDQQPAYSDHLQHDPYYSRKRTNGRRFVYSNHYRHVVYEDENFHLGTIQAKVIERLHNASQNGEPWIYGKVLLHDAGSQCNRMRDVFKSQPEWRNLIESDGKGHYRLRAA
ncbi:MAG: hypothetical protein COV36_02320 [Alphaproteobacteria bacterium CG11_big_fil_rev_8_21_14_0_20_44_7]|nr:MAG: hypothetical protein COV36_02320 [Alphaproteobacteria bacterium CG11_big_fil_rev_8_21_14_0_20_44_7]|tara:strand:- start:5715 stop:6452 length:738 start_codon:yes stop_codon:yes gene_type:complete